MKEVDDEIASAVQSLADALLVRRWTMCTAESCTGGLVAAACTSLAGSSDWFERGLVSYSNAAKTELLGVPAELVARHGAVSAEVACAMADGALARTPADAAVAVTGIAGPGGATPGKPVGTVWVAVATRTLPAAPTRLQLAGDRTTVRRDTVLQALRLLHACLPPQGV